MKPIDIEAEIRDWQQRRAALKAELVEHPERYFVITEKLEAMDAEHHRIVEAARQPTERLDDMEAGEAVDEEDFGQHQEESHDSGFNGVFADVFNEQFRTSPAPKPHPKDYFRLSINVSASDAHDLTHLLEMALYEVRKEIEARKQARTWVYSPAPLELIGDMDGTVGSYKTSLKIGSKPDEDEIPH